MHLSVRKVCFLEKANINIRLIAGIFLLVVGTLSLLSLLLVAILNIDLHGDIRYRKTMLGALAITSSRIMLEFEWGYFEDVESATSYLGEDIREVVRFEEGSYLFVIFPGDVEGPFYRPFTSVIYSYLFLKQENSMLYLLQRWTQGIESLYADPRGNWYDEDRVARDIVYAYVQSEITARVNRGIPLLYGVGTGNPPAYMSILGYEPDRMILFEHRGEIYFFWYYRSKSQFGEILSMNIDVSEPFTLGEVIVLFDIQIIQEH